jgi:serine O-acetyltransferase
MDWLFESRWNAVRIYRLSKRLEQRGHKRLAKMLQALNLALAGVDIEPLAEFGPGLSLRHSEGIVVFGGVRAGRNCHLFQQVTLGVNHKKPGGPVIGDNVTIYAGAKILGPVRIGDGAVIGANAVVVRDVPPGAIVKAPLGVIEERPATPKQREVT